MQTGRPNRPNPGKCSGVVLVGLLISIAILSIGLAQLGIVWSAAAARERAKEADWIGAQYVNAIKSYRYGSAGVVVKTYPPNLMALVEDARFLVPVRHIRRLYPNPFTGQADWIPIYAVQGGIRGVKAVVKSEEGEKVFQYLVEEVVPPNFTSSRTAG